jgi:site-specific DNA recombinase
VDRLSRSVRGLAEGLETLDAAGGGFRSATEPFDTTSPAGRMMIQRLGVIAEFERATIVDRMIAGMELKASQGGWCGGNHPFGYWAAKGEDTLDVDEAASPLILVIFDLYVNKRLGIHASANWLRDAGLSTRAGKPRAYKAILTICGTAPTWERCTSAVPGQQAPIHPSSRSACSMPDQVILSERGQDV